MRLESSIYFNKINYYIFFSHKSYIAAFRSFVHINPGASPSKWFIPEALRPPPPTFEHPGSLHHHLEQPRCLLHQREQRSLHQPPRLQQPRRLHLLFPDSLHPCSLAHLRPQGSDHLVACTSRGDSLYTSPVWIRKESLGSKSKHIFILNLSLQKRNKWPWSDSVKRFLSHLLFGQKLYLGHVHIKIG